jgi:predicted outer membrane repeat protein
MNYNPFSLSGKKILVTGASSGIGREIAVSCSKMGAQLVITARNEERLNKTLTLLSAGEHQLFLADLNSDDDIQKLTDAVSGLNGLVNTAGILQPFPIKYISRKQIDSMFSTNYNSVVLLCAKLIKQKKIIDNASVVFISSVSSHSKPYFGGALYSGTKAAIEAYSRTFAIEYASRKIRSNCISPAIVTTPIFDDYLAITTTENVKEYEKQYPLGFGNPIDVANAAIYLLSDASRWVTGSTIIIDGGLLS